jgi:ribose transport system substrate-binding protein
MSLYLSPRARRVAVAVPLVGALLLAGCASSSSTGTAAAQCDPQENSSKKFTIGISQWDLKEPYRSQAKADYDRLVNKYPQFTLDQMDAQGSVDKQISDVEALLTKQVDLIIIYPGDSAGLQNAVKEVHSKGVPLLEVDRSTPDASQYDALLGGDNRAIAEQEASYLAQNLPQGAKVAIITGDLSSDAATERLEGAKEGLKTRPDLKVLPEQTAKWRAELAQTVVEAILKANPDLAGIVYANDEESNGGWKALKAAGKDTQVKQVGIDGLKDPAGGMQEVKDGKLLATFVYPNGAPQALEAANQILVKCQTVEKRQIIDTERVDASNVDAMMAEGNG